MSETKWQRWGAWSGLFALGLGVVGGFLERGWPAGSDPDAVARFVQTHQGVVLAQSMLFVLSTCINVWFFATIYGYLRRREGAPGVVSLTAFAGGLIWAAMTLVAQSFQIGVAMSPDSREQSAFLWTMSAAFGLSNLPLAVMLFGDAAVSLRTKAFPRWLAVLGLIAGIAQVALWVGTVMRAGPLAADGWLSYALYPLVMIWLIPTAVVLIRRLGEPQPAKKRTEGPKVLIPQRQG